MTRNTELTRTALYRLALQRFGPDAQALKLAEEAAELAASAARNLNGQGSESDLAAELADVEIMTEQLRLQGMDRLIDFHKQKKLERLAARLGVIGNDSNLLIVFYVQIMPDDFVMQLHRF